MVSDLVSLDPVTSCRGSGDVPSSVGDNMVSPCRGIDSRTDGQIYAQFDDRLDCCDPDLLSVSYHVLVVFCCTVIGKILKLRLVQFDLSVLTSIFFGIPSLSVAPIFHDFKLLPSNIIPSIKYEVMLFHNSLKE